MSGDGVFFVPILVCVGVSRGPLCLTRLEYWPPRSEATVEDPDAVLKASALASGWQLLPKPGTGVCPSCLAAEASKAFLRGKRVIVSLGRSYTCWKAERITTGTVDWRLGHLCQACDGFFVGMCFTDVHMARVWCPACSMRVSAQLASNAAGILDPPIQPPTSNVCGRKFESGGSMMPISYHCNRPSGHPDACAWLPLCGQRFITAPGPAESCSFVWDHLGPCSWQQPHPVAPMLTTAPRPTCSYRDGSGVSCARTAVPGNPYEWCRDHIDAS